MAVITPPTHIVWSTDRVDLSDPFQRRWYIQQVLTHGRMEDVRRLEMNEVLSILDELILPDDVRSLWETVREAYHSAR
jgi:hypothetical protein